MTSTRLAVIAAMLILATACDGTTTGQPGPQSTRQENQSSTSRPTGSPTAEVGPFDGMDPCQLLSTTELAQFGVTTPGKRDDLSGTLGCVWNPPTTGIYSLTLDPVRPVAQLNRTNATNIVPVTIGRHHGQRAEEGFGPGFCGIDLVITDSTSASVDADSFDQTAQACAQAERLANIIEPKLP